MDLASSNLGSTQIYKGPENRKHVYQIIMVKKVSTYACRFRN